MQHYMVCSMTAFIGAVLTFSYGMWPESLTLLVVAMGVDYVTGVSAALMEKRGLNSGLGAWGLAKKGIMLLVILLSHRIDVLFGLANLTMGGAIYFYIANELISITENLGRLGVPMPDKLRQAFEVLKNKK